MFNKKGEGLSISTIVYLILGLLVLILLILIFTGQASSIFDSVKETIQNVLGMEPSLEGVK
ncbi:MAG: hypothetical protein ABIH25_02705 [Candidatus Woesearchaeota archaeon]